MKTIPLTQGLVALVDDEDYEELSRHKWCAMKVGKKWYAVRKEFMHRAVLNADPGVEIDHENGDSLDCQKHNLRPATSSQNKANRASTNKSGYRGVYLNGRKFRAQISVNHKTVVIGSFDDPITAAHAYDAAAREHFGEFARTNF